MIITLLVITTLTGLAIAFSEDSNVELHLAAYSLKGFRAGEVARSGIHVALAALDQDENRDMDSLREPWAELDKEGFPGDLPEGGALTLRVVDESGKININLLRNDNGEIDESRTQQIRRLFSALGLEESLVEPILDWLDNDDMEQMNGAESYYYRNLPEPYSCGNGPFLTMGQVLLVKGIRNIPFREDRQSDSILNYLTIYSDGKININTAPVEVLRSLSERMDSALAQAVIDYRKDEDFEQIDDLKRVPGVEGDLYNEIKEGITVKSSAFSLEAQGRFQEVQGRIRAVVLRDPEKMRPIYWQVM